MDFADALHLALAGPVVGIATMDQRIQAMVTRLKLPDRVVLVSRIGEPDG
jgi:hypothetical protein